MAQYRAELDGNWVVVKQQDGTPYQRWYPLKHREGRSLGDPTSATVERDEEVAVSFGGGDILITDLWGSFRRWER